MRHGSDRGAGATSAGLTSVRCRLQIATGTAIWYHSGMPPVPIRWGAGARPYRHSQAAGLDATPACILGWFVYCWSIETTFRETREQLGVDPAAVVSDLATRTTPALLGVFSLITL